MDEENANNNGKDMENQNFNNEDIEDFDEVEELFEDIDDVDFGLHALIELLISKGLITQEEYEKKFEELDKKYSKEDESEDSDACCEPVSEHSEN